MKQILGLHVGTESVGWALVRQSTSPRIVNMGTRIFSSFVSYLGVGDREISKATIRTQARNARKIYSRKTDRKKKVLLFLAQYDLCPLSVTDLKKWHNNTLSSSSNLNMQQWFALDPYELKQ